MIVVPLFDLEFLDAGRRRKSRSAARGVLSAVEGRAETRGKAETGMARCRAAIASVALTGLILAGHAASADPVPLPRPAPLPKTQTERAPAAVPSTPPAAQEDSRVPGWLPQIFGGRPDPNTAAEQAKTRALLDKVNNYLSTVQVMSGKFVQVGPDGRQSKGQFYVQKPGKVRFDYDAPSTVEIVADGSSVVVLDRRLDTKDVYQLSQTPLRFLLTDRIDLLRDANVTNVYLDEHYVTVVVEETQLLIGTSRLMMMFGAKDFALKQWVVTDPQGYDTTIAVSNLDTTRRPDPNLFRIDYTNYPN
jgi:outer membrane lipoprotein-sorting protein